MRKKIVVALILSIILSVALTGCGGGGAKVETHSQTLGQQLIDLDKAYKTGVITEKEYKKAKENILKMYK